MLKTKRRRWLLVAALFFLAAFGVAIAQIVTAQGEEASGVRHILRTNASGELITAVPSTATEVEGSITDGAAAGTQKPVSIGGVDGPGNVQRMLIDTTGRLMVMASPAYPVHIEGTTGVGNPPGGQEPVTIAGIDTAGNIERLLTSPAGELHTLNAGFSCSLSAPISTAGAGTTQIIALAGTTVIRICHISLSWDAAVDWRIVRGTGANCATGTVNMTDDYRNITAIGLDFGAEAALRGGAGSAVCMTQTGAGNSGGVVSYAQF